jgi:hypothetical protein
MVFNAPANTHKGILKSMLSNKEKEIDIQQQLLKAPPPAPLPQPVIQLISPDPVNKGLVKQILRKQSEKQGEPKRQTRLQARKVLQQASTR